jgi:hypothetical protein
MPASPQSNDDDDELEPTLAGALGPVDEEAIATRAGDGAITTFVGDGAASTCADEVGRGGPSIHIACAAVGKPAAAIAIPAANPRFVSPRLVNTRTLLGS